MLHLAVGKAPGRLFCSAEFTTADAEAEHHPQHGRGGFIIPADSQFGRRPVSIVQVSHITEETAK